MLKEIKKKIFYSIIAKQYIFFYIFEQPFSVVILPANKNSYDVAPSG